MIGVIALWAAIGLLALITVWHEYRLDQHNGALRSIRSSISLHLRDHTPPSRPLESHTRPYRERGDGG